MSKKKRIIYVAIASAIIVIAALAMIFMPKTALQTVTEMLSTAQKYLVEMEYERAIAEFNKVIELDPMNADAYLGLAEAYEKSGQHDMAVKTLEKGYEVTGDERIRAALEALMNSEDADETETVTAISEETTVRDISETTDESESDTEEIVTEMTVTETISEMLSKTETISEIITESETVVSEESIEDVKTIKDTINSMYRGEDILYYNEGDFCGNGSTYAYAIVGNSNNEDRKVIFAALKNKAIDITELFETDILQLEYTANVVQLETTAIFIVSDSIGSSLSCRAWYIKNGKCTELDSKYIEGLSYCGGNNFEVHVSAFDGTTEYDGTQTGHTWKTYWLDWNGNSFTEYGGMYISEEQLMQINGAEEYIQKKKNDGYELKNIIYRGNNMININFSKSDDSDYVINENITLKLNKSACEYVNEDDGIYELAAYPDIAIYPDSFEINN